MILFPRLSFAIAVPALAMVVHGKPVDPEEDHTPTAMQDSGGEGFLNSLIYTL